jgi:pSer/pThr/pTyr-binding forkhead associated (FHA) protein
MAEIQFFLKKVTGGAETPIKGEMTIGRGDTNMLRLTEGNPSRNHATITLRDNTIWIKDRNSTNGTFVNGSRLVAEKEMRLAANYKIRFDLEEYLLRIVAPPEPLADKDRTAMRPAESLVAEAAKPHVPPTWADAPENTGGNKTVFKTIEQMEEERKRQRAQFEDPTSKAPVTVPQLTIYGDTAPVTVELRVADPSQCEWSVGSDEGREIRINRDGVSGLHAKIVNAGKVWKVVDQVSGNGTFVNGKRVNVSYLQSGDRIAFGPAECLFQAPGGKPRASASASGATGGKSSAGSPPMDPRRKRGLLIAGLSFLGTLILLVILLKWLG